MADMAPMKTYMGSRGMKRDSRPAGAAYRLSEAKRVERSKADRKMDKRHKEGSRADERADRTLIGKHMKSRVGKGGIY